MKKERLELFWLVIKFSLVALFTAIVIRGFILIPLKVEGNSMENALHQDDMIVMEKISEIKRFDVVVFQLASGTTYIKRVIGLPGDTLRYENDQLYVNDQRISETFLKDEIKATKDSGHFTNDFSLLELLHKEKLGKDEYFVMGDNRRLSKDSRSFGPITSQEILGKAQFVYYPLQHLGLVSES